MSLYDFSATSGPPARKGDNRGFKSTVDAMKIGLRAHYTKVGKPQPYVDITTSSSTSLLETQDDHQYKIAPSVTKEALKTGLRAWYSKHGKPLHETTVAPSVGDGTERRLGGGFHTPGAPGRHRSYPKGGTSLRADIQNLERSLERTLASLSNRRHITDGEEEEFRNLLVDALSRLVLDGDRGYFRDALMHASLIESRFMGKPIPETSNVLTRATDLGSTFRQRMNENGPMVEMIANQLSSGMPLNVVVNNVVASHNSTASVRVRQTLSDAHDVLLGLR